MANHEYFNLEFDVSPEPGREEIDSFFSWANSYSRQLVRKVEGTEQIRLKSESGYQLLLVRPNAEHQASEAWHRSEINKDILMRTHIVKPDASPWQFAWGEDNEVTVNILELTYTEGVGYLVDLPVSETETRTFPITPSIQETMDTIFAEQLRIAPWE